MNVFSLKFLYDNHFLTHSNQSYAHRYTDIAIYIIYAVRTLFCFQYTVIFEKEMIELKLPGICTNCNQIQISMFDL